jgi:tRNA-guanine transglycosylase
VLKIVTYNNQNFKAIQSESLISFDPGSPIVLMPEITSKEFKEAKLNSLQESYNEWLKMCKKRIAFKTWLLIPYAKQLQSEIKKIYDAYDRFKSPAFITVGTKATVKALTPEQVRDYVGAQAVLANTYHLYLQPGDKVVAEHGGFPKMMGWSGPSFTDSGGFQVFSLGQALGHGVSKIATSEEISQAEVKQSKRDIDEESRGKVHEKMATIDDDGVTFKSVIDGSEHRFTPEKSMQIQHNLGADIFFAFDECTSPLAPIPYQREAMNRTHTWAKRCIDEHKRLGVSAATGEMQALFGVVQGGAYEELRRESARILGAIPKKDEIITLGQKTSRAVGGGITDMTVL